MEAQYRSINRGGHSIFEKVREAGFDPYVRCQAQRTDR
jgi:phospholipase D1/2